MKQRRESCQLLRAVDCYQTMLVVIQLYFAGSYQDEEIIVLVGIRGQILQLNALFHKEIIQIDNTTSKLFFRERLFRSRWHDI